uniref:Uncharacterized protein n=1 Tax=uncultured marine thaumarchaeote SAT1000_15_H02 TaxID=1456386 RepID=A0A075I6F3_9ARCH|nr:hypothetical protein [uncultured marine thaumarchaeote SAT1000_15_H02]
MGKTTLSMNVSIICMLFFAFLIGVIPTSFAEEENDMSLWNRATLDSDYFVHFQAQVRDIDGSLVSVIETFEGEYLLDSRTESSYSVLPLKQVVEISNKKYEVRQLASHVCCWEVYGYTAGAYNVGFEIDGQYVIVFHAFPPMFIVENDDVITVQWTIFKKI